MLWRNRRESGNVLDQRRIGGKTLGAGGLVIGAIVYALMGGNPLDYIAQNSDQLRTGQSSRTGAPPANDDQKRFVSVVLGDTEDVWNDIFKRNDSTYREPKLVLFTQAVRTACGHAGSAVGPFYCPADERVYLDLGFFDQLSRSLGARGDFAQAYVIAHEVGHHVQHLLGVDEDVRRRQAAAGRAGANRLSVRLELQADCLAGVWAKHTERAKQVIESGDVEEAMTAAAAVGDDRLQRKQTGEVVPDSFTHGSSAQRVEAFRAGFSNADPQTCLQGYSADSA
jgi:predicted metalloprotease